MSPLEPASPSTTQNGLVGSGGAQLRPLGEDRRALALQTDRRGRYQ